jgi:hypothetical protein
MRKYIFALSLFITISFFQNLIAQNSPGDTTYRRIALQQVTDFYFRSIGENALVYNGSEVLEYPGRAESHPFYESDKFVKGSINSNGLLYNDIPILYDIVHDKLIVLDYNKVFKVEQISERVENFSCYGHSYERLSPDSINISTVTTGFYDRLYIGRSVALYAKRQKMASEILKETHTELVFKQRNSYFIRKGVIYYPVSDRSSVLNVLKDKKPELDKFLKKNKIKFKKNPEFAMIKLAEYYDSLRN